jgi:hypothetical protein
MSRYRGPKLRITRRLGYITKKKSNKVNRAEKTEMLMLILVRN